MLDFLMIAARSPKKGMVEIYPKFIIRTSKDLMIRGGDFYAVWNEEEKLWSTKEEVALQLIDKELDAYAETYKRETDDHVKILHMWDAESGMIDKWHKYVQKQMRDSYHMLDSKLIFQNTETKKTDYASKKLPYSLESGTCEAYNELMETLYAPEERKKIEWSIGSIISGDSVKLQKFLVMYGSAGTGKSTVLNIIQDLFEGYYSVFDAKALGTVNNVFALEAFKTNPLVAIQHDGDLSRIEDNTRLNSVVSHELMTVNEKFKSTYSNRFNSFLFMGTNKPVRITDAKSGILRRLIDVSPTGKKLSLRKYKELTGKIKFELGAIANHCKEVYESDKGAYDDYIPTSMLGASNDFYNFVLDSYEVFREQDGTTLKAAWEMYKQYCDDAKVMYPYSQRNFKEELKNYFKSFEERTKTDDDVRVRNYYGGFIVDKFRYEAVDNEEKGADRIIFEEGKSILDEILKDCPAQYANEKGTPTKKWDEVTTTLADIDTSKLHYVKLPKNHIVIDFDIPGEDGKKSFEKNLEAASKWPRTYAELSKSGSGIHLHYIYEGDVSKLSRVYAEHIEIKVPAGKSSLRRMLTKCCNAAIAVISSGLPLKGVDKTVNFDAIKSEKALRTLIQRNLNKEIHPATKPSMDFIFKILDDAYKNGLKYDVTDLRPAIMAFAANSSHQAPYCIKLVNQMQFKSEEPSQDSGQYKFDELIFYDVEVFPNLFLVNWKPRGKGRNVVRMINPKPADIENLIKYKLVGFNNRRYDNHMLYACLMGYNNQQLFDLSQRIVNGSKNAFFGEAYNLSYTDIYDFSSKKQSLKKFEIELGIHHQELGLPWDQPVPEDQWERVAEYCDNDVLATEAVFEARQQDFVARQILADISGLTVNDTTRMHTTKIIFGNEKHPKLVYTDLSEMFPGYEYKDGHSFYRGEDPGEGGYVYSEPGMYDNIALLDIASMHPTSIIQLNLFGEYTSKFKDILDARLNIKHHNFEAAKKLLGGALKPYLKDEAQADSLAQALKIVINSVYGFTTATFDNPFKDPRNKDNIVAKRGALFMINLKHEVQDRGYTVAHIKTDSIKIPNATPEIIQFVIDYGKQYGYNFELEGMENWDGKATASYDRMCLVNDAVYIAKYGIGKKAGKWTATGTQFQIPYVFKTLFSKEEIEFDDMCETKSVSTALYLDLNEGLPEGEHNYHFVGKVGRFCPIKPGRGGGLLMREKDGKYYAAGGSKGYRWLESEMVKNLGKENDIDRSYYIELVDNAVAAINEYGDFEGFVS